LKLTLHLRIMLHTNQFITSVPAYKTIFARMTILKPSVHQLHLKHLWHVKKLIQKYKLASYFGSVYC